MLSSGLPRPATATSTPSALPSSGSNTLSSPAGNNNTELRTRNKRKDEVIRRTASNLLLRKKSSSNLRSGESSSSTPSSSNRKPKAGTVASLKPALAITVEENCRIVQVAQLMAAKRNDCVLVLDAAGNLSGILTDKDIAYRVVAEGLDVRSTTVSSVMTPNPVSVSDKGPRSEALATMTQRKFRHLPVIADLSAEYVEDEDAPSSAVVGLLDITKCVFDRLDDLEKKVNEDNNIIQAVETLERRGSIAMDQVSSVKTSHGCPDVGSVIDQTGSVDIVPEVSFRASVRNAAKMMKERHHTAVLVVSSSGADGADDKLGGIFTTKDVVLRVIAAGLDPTTTSVVRVMTPHPDSVSSDTTILDALKKLHAGHYLHLPVTVGLTPVGLVDVQQLTMAMLNYLMKKEYSASLANHGPSPLPGEAAAAVDGAGAGAGAINSSVPESGPMWTKFWNSTLAAAPEGCTTTATIEAESDRQSVTSADGKPPLSPCRSQQSLTSPRATRSVMARNRKVSDEQLQSVAATTAAVSQKFAETLVDGMFPFKVKDNESGRIFRLTSSYTDYTSFSEIAFAKAGIQDPEEIACRRFSYEDDEGDIVFVDCDKSLEESVSVAKRCGLTRVIVYIDTPESLRKAEEKAKLDIEREQELDLLRKEAAAASLSNNNDGGMLGLLTTAPLSIHVAISAGIVITSVWIIKKMF